MNHMFEIYLKILPVYVRLNMYLYTWSLTIYRSNIRYTFMYYQIILNETWHVCTKYVIV